MASMLKTVKQYRCSGGGGSASHLSCRARTCSEISISSSVGFSDGFETAILYFYLYCCKGMALNQAECSDFFQKQCAG